MINIFWVVFGISVTSIIISGICLYINLHVVKSIEEDRNLDLEKTNK